MNSNPANPKIQDWLNDIELGLRYKKKYSSCLQWQKYRGYYRGVFPPANESSLRNPHNEVVINRTFSWIKAMIPRLYFRNPGVLAIPSRPEFVANARVIESIDNWLIRETGLKSTLKSAILDAALCGTGPIKLGYDSEFGFNPDLSVDRNQGTVSQVGVKDGQRIEYNTNINAGMPWALRAQPDELITPYGYSKSYDLPWVAQAIIRPVEDIKQDQKYSRSRRNKIVGGFSVPSELGRPFAAWQTGNNDKGRFALMYEIRDRRTGKFSVICEDQLLLEMDDTLQIDGLPWEFLIFNEDPEHFWGLSDVAMFEDQQLELNEIRSHARRMRRLEIIKFLYQSDVFEKNDLEKLLSGDPYDMGVGIGVNTDAIAAAIFEFKAHTNTDGLIREQEQTENDLRDIMGFSQNQAGNFSPFHNKTAKEAGIVETASNIRSDERRDQVADMISSILRKWNQYIFKYWTNERVTQIVGNDGHQYWIKYTGDQIRGEYAMNIQPEEGMPISREVRHQTAGELFQMLNQDPMIEQIGLRRLLLQQTDIIDPSYMTLLRPPSPPPGMEGMSEGNPIGIQELAAMDKPGQALGTQPNPTGGGNAPA